MKNLLLPILCFFVTYGWATTRTVSNDPTGGSQFIDLQSAYDASTNGDTLLIEGTNNTYTLTTCGQIFTKSLTVIGIGFNPQKQNARRTLIGGTSCINAFRLSSSGMKFYGIEFNVSVQLSSSTNNVIFEDCKFDVANGFAFNSQSASNFAFRNCIFDSNNGQCISIGNTVNVVSNILVSNCVFDGFIDGTGNTFGNMTVDHCLFLGTSCFSNLFFATITNCIFMNAFPGSTGNSSYLNNLSRSAGTWPPSGLGGNTASNNIVGATNPNFVSYTLGAFYATDQDYHLQAGSAAIGAGSDGTDIGIHGGNSNFSEQGEVLINPIMRQVIINNSSVTPNGSLNVQIIATKPKDN